MDTYRSLVEVLKYLPLFDVLKTTSLLNSHWREVSDSDELWRSFLPEQVNIAETGSGKDFYYRNLLKCIYVVQKAKVLKYYLGAQIWSELPLSRAVKINKQGSVSKLKDGTLFCCGGNSPSENTFNIDLSTGSVHILPSLNPNRHGIGLLALQDTIYAFCGTIKKVLSNNCDSMDLRSRRWTPLPPATHKRAYFNPCFHSSKIYLLGGASAGQDEYYDLRAKKFSSLHLNIALNGATTACLKDSDLVIITEAGIARRNMGSSGTYHFRAFGEEGENLYGPMWSGFDPVRVEEKVYILQRSESRILEVDINTLNWTGIGYSGDSKKVRCFKR